jgi:hypothetical protein
MRLECASLGLVRRIQRLRNVLGQLRAGNFTQDR